MADTKSILNLVVADQSSKLADFAIGHQQIIFLQDKRTLALDYNGKRSFYNQIEILQTEAERKKLTDPTSGLFYFVIGTSMFWYYDTEWINLTAPPENIVFIGTENPEFGSENTLYVDKDDREISVWDEKTGQYIIVANYTESATDEDIERIFKKE